MQAVHPGLALATVPKPYNGLQNADSRWILYISDVVAVLCYTIACLMDPQQLIVTSGEIRIIVDSRAGASVDPLDQYSPRGPLSILPLADALPCLRASGAVSSVKQSGEVANALSAGQMAMCGCNIYALYCLLAIAARGHTATAAATGCLVPCCAANSASCHA
jgi:hypothetical protein